ncbi:MAG: transcriptional regulator [Candidatus Woesebacteria bacterium GW2011_GWB1_43_14]|uniref:Probable transcriptional regulatory protein UV74_C0013G0130 n=1 Tax=Candidatus Woesebacteria bacterium GW2011_GWB1_43_14 TaxID=1618578 RepID=A0A0G1GDQ3_9BACT|nr:MAG: protein of unknown function DUF28 [Candidatus Woesebacteria bacterium GW2011_GWC1_42_9]KKS97008.1 MAG: transcriptional regulator [Candidatus Woesebacteria bacterium GW2011_GWB1_43_14]
MSGHSKWSTIKRQKGVNDAKRGQLFSKMSKIISIAARDGGANLESNQKLKVAVEAAKTANMPKINIERAIASAGKEGKNYEEVVYEGFAPEGLGILIEATTDNRNRTGQEIKNILERSGGAMGGPGSASFNFVPKGLILLAQKKLSDDEMLKVIDLGIDEVEETPDGVEIYTPPSQVYEIEKKIRALGMGVDEVELTQKPKISTTVSEPKKSEKLSRLLEDLDDHEDVQKIHPSFKII